MSSNASRASTDRLTSLTYRSRAAQPMSTDALRALERTAQARNHSEGLTGLAIYDEGRFFQWLEGPAESLSRVWESVRNDTRHTDIESVTVRETTARMFEGWDMTLSVRGAKPLTALSPEGPVLSLVRALDPLVVLVEGEPVVQWGKMAESTSGPVIPILPLLVEAVVLPTVLSSRASVRRFLPRVSAAAARLTQFLLAEDPAPAAALLRRLYARAGSLAPLCATVIEPAARSLGDLWLADDCSQIDMTMALCRLDSLAQQLTVEAPQLAMGLPAVLVATQPGEGHLVGASLDADLLWQAGWDTHREFPESDGALQAVLADTWFDVLDLSLSPAVSRPDWLPQMAETIVGARAASKNPALTVVVGGRDFFEQCEASESVGADASTASALQVVLSVTSALQKTLTRVAQRTALVTSS